LETCCLSSTVTKAPVIFGEKGDSALLGTVSLKALGLLPRSIRRELRTLPMVLGFHRARPAG
jgi:hypothetical protein